MFIPKNPENVKHRLKAVSPVIATLVLIVIAIVGAVAVGLIMSRVAATTSSAANVNNVSQNAAETLTIGGSAVIFPVSNAALGSFEAQYPGINVQLVQGGSGAGMEGVIIGALDIGESGSYPVFTSYQSSAAALNPPVNLVGTNIGGSGVVIIEHGAGPDGLLTDGNNDECLGITASALNTIYTDETFYISNLGCQAASPNFSTLQSSAVLASAGAGESGPFTAVSRADLPSGTQETFGAWAGFSSSQQDTLEFGSSGGVTETGDQGILSYVQSNANTIGFVDIGIAEGGSLDIAQQVALPALTDLAVSAAPANYCSGATVPSTPSSAPIFCYVASSTSTNGKSTPADTKTNNLDSTVRNALSGGGPEFPDNGAGTNQLSRTFWLVTNGAPTSAEQDFIDFLINPAQSQFFTSAGYYPVYSYRTG